MALISFCKVALFHLMFYLALYRKRLQFDASSVEFDLFLSASNSSTLSTSACVSVRAQSSHNSIPPSPLYPSVLTSPAPYLVDMDSSLETRHRTSSLSSSPRSISLSRYLPLSHSCSLHLLLLCSFSLPLSLTCCKAVNTLINIFRAM